MGPGKIIFAPPLTLQSLLERLRQAALEGSRTRWRCCGRGGAAQESIGTPGQKERAGRRDPRRAPAPLPPGCSVFFPQSRRAQSCGPRLCAGRTAKRGPRRPLPTHHPCAVGSSPRLLLQGLPRTARGRGGVSAPAPACGSGPPSPAAPRGLVCEARSRSLPLRFPLGPLAGGELCGRTSRTRPVFVEGRGDTPCPRSGAAPTLHPTRHRALRRVRCSKYSTPRMLKVRAALQPQKPRPGTPSPC